MPAPLPILVVRLEATGEARRVAGGLRVGRVPEDNDWVLDAAAPRPRVSRSHCRFDVSPQGCSVTDLGSLNGTFVNGQRLPPRTASALRSGDVVAVGNHRFRIEIAASDPLTPPAADPAAPPAGVWSESGFIPRAAQPDGGVSVAGPAEAPPWPAAGTASPPLFGASGQQPAPPPLTWPPPQPDDRRSASGTADVPPWAAAGTAPPPLFGASGQQPAPPPLTWPPPQPDDRRSASGAAEPPPLAWPAASAPQPDGRPALGPADPAWPAAGTAPAQSDLGAGQATMPPLVWGSADPGSMPGQAEAGGPSALEQALRSLIDRKAASLPFGNPLPGDDPPADPQAGSGADLWPGSGGPQHEALPVGRPDPAAIPPDPAPLAAFLAGAGLTPDQVGAVDPAAFLRDAGAVFAAMAAGYQQLLGVRGRIKLDARLKRTQDGAEANNPLKHALDGRQAVLALLRAQGPAYLRPRTAVHDAVQALAAHELAMLDAFQAAIADLLDAFHPNRLEGKLNAEGSLAVLARGGRRASLWELYVERYAEIVRAARTRSLGAFDEAFRDAYERRAAAVMEGAPAVREDVP